MQAEEQHIYNLSNGILVEGLGPTPWVDLGGGAVAKIKLFRNMVMLHIN